MFNTENINLVADVIYINKHTLESFTKRNKNQKIDLSVGGIVEVNVLVQRHIKERNITALKGVVTLKNGLFLLVNIYKNKINNILTMKTLTILTEFQLITSYNLNFGNHLNKGYNVIVDNILVEDKFFDYSLYDDFLNGIEWTEDDVVLMHEENYTPTGSELKIVVPKTTSIYAIKKPYKNKKIIITSKKDETKENNESK